MNAVGTHLLVEFQACNVETLNNLQGLRTALISAAEEVGATVIGDTFHQFSPHGVTGVVAIAESHLCVHTWPEYGYAAVDIFTCGDSLTPHLAVERIADYLESEDHQVTEIRRGPRSPVATKAAVTAQA